MKLQFKPARLIDHIATGEQVREARVKAGLKLGPVAEAMKITVAFLSDLERGRRNWTEELIGRVSLAIKKPAK